MSQSLNVKRLLVLALITASAAVAHANSPPAHSFSDEALKQAGWTNEQIAELRAQTPQQPVKNKPETRSEYSYSSVFKDYKPCLLYTSPSPRDRQKSRMPSSA